MTEKQGDKVIPQPQKDEPSTFGLVSEWLGLSSPKTRDTSNKPLFGADGEGIKYDAVVQGGINNCFFMAPLSSVAQAYPQVIRESIKQNSDGSYTVTFAGARDKPQLVQPLTMEEQRKFAQTGPGGVWPAVMEKAFGQYLKNNPDERERILGHSAGWFLDSAQEYADSGKATEVLKLLTGYMPGGIKLKDSHNVDGVQSLLQDNFKDGKALPVVAGIAAGNETALSKGLHPEHDYSVLGYADGIVTVRDPRGRTELNISGKRMESKEGVFKMTVQDFAKAFDEVLVGRNKPVLGGNGALIMKPLRLKP